MTVTNILLPFRPPSRVTVTAEQFEMVQYINNGDYNADDIIDTSYNYYNDYKFNNNNYDRYSDAFEYVVEEAPTPMPAVDFVTENLGTLEELHINFADQYTFSESESSGFDQPTQHTLPSLTHLDLEVSCEWTPIRWLAAAAHITELDLSFCEPFCAESLSHLPKIELPELRIIRASNFVGHDVKTVAAKFVLHFITCPMLRELYLCLNNEVEVELYSFSQRSIPHLQILDLDLDLDLDPREPPFTEPLLPSHRRGIFDSLLLIPSLREFIVRWSGFGDVGDILNALKRTRDPATPHASFALLPALENLVLVLFSGSADLSPSKIIELITARWNAHETTFESFTLSYEANDYPPNSLLFSGWMPNGGYSQLPRVWDRVAPLVSEGLRFRITFKESEVRFCNSRCIVSNESNRCRPRRISFAFEAALWRLSLNSSFVHKRDF